MKRYWMSFYFTGDDYGPLNFPPSPGILGWWCSGETMEEPTRYTLCLLVEAESEEAARELIKKDWPESAEPGTEWRFCSEKPSDFDPSTGGRFPLANWMVERLTNPKLLSDLKERLESNDIVD